MELFTSPKQEVADSMDDMNDTIIDRVAFGGFKDIEDLYSQENSHD